MAPSAVSTENTSSAFPNIPPFPDNVPTAPLLRLNFSALQTSKSERADFLQACKDLGFFYLDLRGDSLGEKLLAESDQLFGVGEALFKEGVEELSKYDFSKGEKDESGGWKDGREPSYMGYKSIGKGVVDAAGNRDKNEFYNTPKDDLLNQSTNPFPHPKPLTQNKDLMASYTRHAHALLTQLLAHLDTGMQLPAGTLAPYHDITLTSGDHIRFVHSPAPPLSNTTAAEQPETAALGAHTDFGTLTLLFNRLGGLQVLLPPHIVPDTAIPEEQQQGGRRGAGGTWAYVRPLPGHAVVNLGDALVKFSGGLLRSNIHRVVAPPGKQQGCSRLSLVYFMRPGDEVVLKRLKGGIVPEVKNGEEGGEEVTAKKWIIDKATQGMKLMSERTKDRETNRQLVELQEGGCEGSQ